MTDKVINWTPDMLKRFKRAYTKARDDKLEVFIFDDNQYVLSYARYLIEYLDSKFLNFRT